MTRTSGQPVRQRETGTWAHRESTDKDYVNGRVSRSTNDEDPNKTERSRDLTGLAIGNRAENTERQFNGIVDDVRVYDYGLSEGKVAWLATDGTGYLGLASEANLYDLEAPGEKAVNFRDIALLIDEHWLEEKKWP
ncbi:MAG: LamG-like jellyroll fold domain-containing protein [Planctomycetota bacterium]